MVWKIISTIEIDKRGVYVTFTMGRRSSALAWRDYVLLGFLFMDWIL
jgi:hypothetical protein